MPEISVDEFLSKRTLSAHDGVLYRSSPPMKSFDKEARTARFVMTDESIDSYGDEVKAAGVGLDRFEKNPVALLNHRSSDLIGQWKNVEKKKKSVEGDVILARAGTSAEVDKVFNLMDQNILRAASIGFLPKRLERKVDDKGNALWEYIIHECELFECSVVSIPANPNALAKSMKEGDRLCRDLIEEVLDTYTRGPSGLIVPIAEFQKAHKEGDGNKTVHMNVGLDAKAMEAIVAKAIGEAMAKAGIKIEQEPEPDPIVKELETAMEEFEKKVEELPEAEVERKGLLSKIFGDIRTLFKSAPEPKVTEKQEQDKPVLASEEEKRKARQMLLELEAEDLAA